VDKVPLRTNDVSRYTTLTVNALPGVSLLDQMLETTQKAEGILAFVGGVITGNVGTWLYRKIKRGKNDQNDNLHSRL
jgi:hypothetical protein